MSETVLVVDDDPDIRLVAALTLRSIGHFEVIEAANGADAIEAAIEHQPDVILLDAMMPGMSGPAALARLRQDERTANIPIIFLTARVRPEQTAQYAALGADAVIGKPFDPVHLAEQLREILDRVR